MTGVEFLPARLIAGLLLAPIVALGAGVSVSRAEEHGSTGATASTHESRGVKGEHELLLFLGVTDDRGEHAFTWGVDYAYGVADHVAVGGFFDRAEGPIRSSVVGVPPVVRPVARLNLVFAPSIERRDDGSEDEGGGSQTEFLARIGVQYGFRFPRRYAIVPAVYADFVGQEIVWVAGMNLGYVFERRRE